LKIPNTKQGWWSGSNGGASRKQEALSSNSVTAKKKKYSKRPSQDIYKIFIRYLFIKDIYKMSLQGELVGVNQPPPLDRGSLLNSLIHFVNAQVQILTCVGSGILIPQTVKPDTRGEAEERGLS
jgi:hypothetical protein